MHLSLFTLQLRLYLDSASLNQTFKSYIWPEPISVPVFTSLLLKKFFLPSALRLSSFQQGCSNAKPPIVCSPFSHRVTS